MRKGSGSLNRSNNYVPENFDLIQRKKRNVIYDDNDYYEEIFSPCNNTTLKLASNGTDDSSLFPDDLFTREQRLKGAIILHGIGLVYMFVALAIVCDEFFVPALGVITEMLLISNDVAGATFMAAGGSMPEFFTSVFGVFITSNNVGIGTIVGSATFNILCVLAFCTLFSKAILKLTWWPLFRDITFYILSLFLLVIFFLDEIIEWFEALIMFLLYILYAIFMKYNETIEEFVKHKLFSRGDSSINIKQETIIDTSEDVMINEQLKKKRNSFQVSRMKSFSHETHYNNNNDGSTSYEASSPGSDQGTIPVLHAGTFFRQSLAQMALDTGGGGEETTRSIEDGNVGTNKPVRRRSSGEKALKTILVKGAPEKATLKYSENNKNFDPPRISKVGDCVTIKSNHLLNESITKKEEKHAKITNSPPAVSIIIESESSEEQGYDEEKKINNDNEEEEEEPLDLTWPTTRRKQLVYLILLPITYSLYFTLPDVRRAGCKKYVAISFIGSILWIAFLSYLMVWWANTIGETFHIPTEIMGLTILAAGTSIPDLITSVIVARKGFGDMAVSSSIGSNLFDVCIGLPIPWLLYFMVDWFKKYQLKEGTITLATISVSSNGLVCSVGLLFLMLVVLIISVAVSRWQMNKIFGIIMIIAYICFCIFSVFLEVGYLDCPLKISIKGKC
uniref:Sodium/potassium/calcium exchanger 2 n=1 Tax=Parastrongyloides trichosuri TaxID=131310 RepID=A0A0N4Z5L2_PARTI